MVFAFGDLFANGELRVFNDFVECCSRLHSILLTCWIISGYIDFEFEDVRESRRCRDEDHVAERLGFY